MVLQMNPTAEILSEVKEPDATGRNIDAVFSLFCEGELPHDAFSVTKSIAQEQDFRIEKELYLLKHDGQKTPVFVNVSPILGTDKSPVGAVIILYDRTRER